MMICLRPKVVAKACIRSLCVLTCFVQIGLMIDIYVSRSVVNGVNQAVLYTTDGQMMRFQFPVHRELSNSVKTLFEVSDLSYTAVIILVHGTGTNCTSLSLHSISECRDVKWVGDHRFPSCLANSDRQLQGNMIYVAETNASHNEKRLGAFLELLSHPARQPNLVYKGLGGHLRFILDDYLLQRGISKVLYMDADTCVLRSPIDFLDSMTDSHCFHVSSIVSRRGKNIKNPAWEYVNTNSDTVQKFGYMASFNAGVYFSYIPNACSLDLVKQMTNVLKAHISNPLWSKPYDQGCLGSRCQKNQPPMVIAAARNLSFINDTFNCRHKIPNWRNECKILHQHGCNAFI